MKPTILLTVALLLLFPRLARAQFGGAIAVQDLLTEQFTEEAAYSLLTGGCAGVWGGQAANLSGWMQMMTSGVADPQAFAALFVGFQDPGPQAIYQAENIANRTLNTGGAALGVVQAQANDFQAEDVSMARIEGCSAGATAVLAAIQANTEAQLAVAQQVQMERQLLMTLINVVAVSNSEVVNEKAQAHAATAVNLNGGTMP